MLVVAPNVLVGVAVEEGNGVQPILVTQLESDRADPEFCRGKERGGKRTVCRKAVGGGWGSVCF
jgi:hypothetical protein